MKGKKAGTGAGILVLAGVALWALLRGKAEAAGFKASNLIIAPKEVNPGQPVTISVTETNTGGEAGSHIVKLRGDAMAEQVVDLQPGESKIVSFEATPQVAKTYQISVDELVGSFEAVTPFATAEAPIPVGDIAMPPYSTLVTIDSFKIRCDFPGNIIYSQITITNHTNRTFVDESPTGRYGGLVTQLAAGIYPSMASIFKSNGIGIGNVPPGTHTYSRVYYGRATVLGPFFQSHGIREGVLGHADVMFNSMDERPTPIITFYRTRQMFEGIFGSSWQEWMKSAWAAPTFPVGIF